MNDGPHAVKIPLLHIGKPDVSQILLHHFFCRPIGKETILSLHEVPHRLKQRLFCGLQFPRPVPQFILLTQPLDIPIQPVQAHLLHNSLDIQALLGKKLYTLDIRLTGSDAHGRGKTGAIPREEHLCEWGILFVQIFCRNLNMIRFLARKIIKGKESFKTRPKNLFLRMRLCKRHG